MKILDRYVLEKFLLPFLYSFLGFVGIWFIFDLSDNLSDFLEGKAGLDVLMTYYSSQVSEIIVIILPFSALLALLYALTAMSRTNEIISMIGAGISVNRILVPLFAIGLILVGVTLYFNYEQAPRAALIKKQMLRDIKRGEKRAVGLNGHMYRNREEQRTWYIRRMVVDEQKLWDIQVLQQDADGNIIKQWYASTAIYEPLTKTWQLNGGKYIEMDLEGNITKQEFLDVQRITNWSESPWRISSSVMNPDFLSVPELEDYLAYNKEFPEARLAPYRTMLENRWALPWGCLVVFFIAGPLGIVYSRRGILGGVALAIGLVCSLAFVTNFFVILGKGNRISPLAAAWVPLGFYFLIGFMLLWYRATNRDLPKIKLPWT